MATFGRLESFDSSSEQWDQYIERLEHFFEANDIPLDTTQVKRRRAILLSVCGSKVYKQMSSLLAPEKSKDKEIDELVSLMKNYFSPKPSVIVQRTKFYTRNRQLGESITDYVAELRSMCEDCRLGTFLDEMLRDKLVVGVNDDNIQRRLLAEKDTITFNEALNIALNMESASKHSNKKNESKQNFRTTTGADRKN